MAFKRFDLRFIEDFFKFAPVEFPYSFDGTRRGEKFFPSRRPESGQFFQNVLLHGFRPGFPIERNGEAVGFVAKVHDNGEFRASFGKFHAFFVRLGKDFLFALGEGSEEGEGNRVRRFGLGRSSDGIGGKVGRNR